MRMKVENKRFWPTIITILITLTLVSWKLEAVQRVVSETYTFFAVNLGWFFILSNIVAFIFVIWIIFGPYAKIRLGGEDAKPSFSTLSWCSMMFTTSCSAGLIIFSFIQPLDFVSNPPFQIKPFSVDAYEYAQVYTHYLWGVNVNAVFVPATLIIAYTMYNLHKTKFSMSVACSPVLKQHSEGIIGTIFDILTIFGSVVAPVTSMGLGMPLLTMLFQEIFGIDNRYISLIEVAILVIWVLIFGTSVYLGLDKGIKNLSNINILLAFIFIIFITIFTGVFDVLKTEINTIGYYISDFARMLTYMDPYGNGELVQNWNVWNCAWISVYMTLMGVFTAKISKGRTLREVALGITILVSVGCWSSVAALGSYSLKVQKNGIIDAVAVLHQRGQAAAVLELLKTMPCSKIIMVVFSLLCFVFMATTVDSSSLVAAELTVKHQTVGTQAPRWCRLLWAIVACCITLVLLRVGGFNAVQLLTVLMGLPLALMIFFIIVSFIKMLQKEDDKH